MGSGKLIKLAIAKYGLENFSKEIIEIFENHDDMFEMESTLVNEEFINRKDTYNITLGGYGGFYYVNETGMNHLHDNRENSLKNLDLGGEAFKKKYKEDIYFREEVLKQLKHMNETLRRLYPDGTFNGKRHSEDSISKMKGTHEKNEHQKGSKNSQYGTMWIHNLEEKLSRKIKKEELPEYEKLGWLKGRKMKF